LLLQVGNGCGSEWQKGFQLGGFASQCAALLVDRCALMTKKATYLARGD